MHVVEPFGVRVSVAAASAGADGDRRNPLADRDIGVGRGEREVRLPADEIVLPTISDIYPTANWHERETTEMFGVTFEGHPLPVTLLLPEPFEGHPLRKDFPLMSREAKPWPGAAEGEEEDEE